MLLYPVKFEFSLFWMSQCGNNNKLALQHGGFCTHVTASCKRPIWSFHVVVLQRMARNDLSARAQPLSFSLTFCFTTFSLPSPSWFSGLRSLIISAGRLIMTRMFSRTGQILTHVIDGIALFGSSNTVN